MEFIPPNEDRRKAIFEDHGLTVDKVKEAEEELMQWLLEQPHLPDHIDENVLTSFAMCCRKGIEDSKKRLDAYFTVRAMFPVLYENRDPLSDEMVENCKTIAHGMCPGYTPECCRVYVAKLMNADVDVFNFNALVRRLLLIQDLTMMRDLKSGIYLVADFTGVTVHHFLKLSISQARDLMFCIQNVYPLRVKKMVFINVKPFCKTLLERMVIPLLKKKIANRTHFFADTKKVSKVVPVEILPRDMGGNGPSSDEVNDFWNNELALYSDWISNEGSTTSDESKREGTSKLSLTEFPRNTHPLKAPGCSVM
uniref:Alpha-tocopherol transfer protein n=1 Tax=Lygus hesperus TaxID=30085 RepID=A0A0A9YE61_LYGHE